MEHRTNSKLIALIMSVAIASCADGIGSGLDVGKAVPISDFPIDAIVVGWSFSARDYLSCQTAAPLLRRLKHVYGDSIAILAITEAVRDDDLLRSFFAAERIPVSKVITNTRTYRRLSVEKGPMLFVARRGEVVHKWQGPALADQLTGDFSEIEDLVATSIRGDPWP